MSVYVDLEVLPAELRRPLYDGDLVILTRLSAVSEFVELHAGRS